MRKAGREFELLVRERFGLFMEWRSAEHRQECLCHRGGAEGSV